MSKPKIGWKVVTKYKGKMYSFGVGFFVWICFHKRNNKTYFKRVTKFLLEYKKDIVIRGKPWIALFKTKKAAEIFKDMRDPFSDVFDIIKVEYVPFEGEILFLDSNNYDECFLLTNEKIPSKGKRYESLLKEHYEFFGKTEYGYPEGTIFASEVKII